MARYKVTELEGGGWLVRAGRQVAIEASQIVRDREVIRAALSVTHNKTLVYRDQVNLTNARKRTHFVKAVEQVNGKLHISADALLALDEAIRTAPTASPRSNTDGASASTGKSDEWVRDKRGRIVVGDVENIRRGLARVGVTLSYDAFARDLRVNGAPVVDDIAFEQLWIRITDTCHWQPSRANLRTVIVCDAQAQATHPVCAYLDGLAWDGTPRLDQWLVTYAGADDTAYVRAVSALPLLAAVRRVRSPGAKFDELLVLESKQGTNKSSALRALCPCDEWFSDDLPLGVDAKLVIERTAGKWILEAAELHSSNRGRETETLKAFLSRQVDGPVRLAYGRLSVSIPRQFVLVGTTNRHGHYLKDSTGARRFWPVSIVGFDVAALTRDRDQLWAEAVRREPGASIRLAAELWAAATAAQEDRRAVDPWEEVIEPLLSDGIVRVTAIAVKDIWAELGVEANARDNRHADRVAAIMERFGYEKTQKANGDRVWRLRGAEHNTL